MKRFSTFSLVCLFGSVLASHDMAFAPLRFMTMLSAEPNSVSVHPLRCMPLRSMPLATTRSPIDNLGRERSMMLKMSDTDSVDKAIKKASSASFSEAQGVGIRLGTTLVESVEGNQEAGDSSKEELRALLSHSDGARGWWVTSLTMQEMEPLYSEKGLQLMVDGVLSNPDPNRKLLVMNIAMSTATAVYWRQEGEKENAEGALLTQRRTATLLRSLLRSLPGLEASLVALKAAADGEVTEGEWATFLQRWNYGDAQRAAIAHQLDLLLTGTNK